MRLGVFGGTFDPPHLGHLAVARTALAALALDRLELIPASVPPHRREPVASAPDRLAMLALLCAGEPGLVASPREILRGGVSFTVETLRALEREEPGVEIFLVLGADSYDELPTWRAADEIARRAHLCVLPRPGSGGADRLRPADAARLRPPGEAPPAGERAVYAIPMPTLPVAARDLRTRLASGESPAADLTPAVFEYIRKRGLYARPPKAPAGGAGGAREAADLGGGGAAAPERHGAR